MQPLMEVVITGIRSVFAISLSFVLLAQISHRVLFSGNSLLWRSLQGWTHRFNSSNQKLPLKLLGRTLREVRIANIPDRLQRLANL